MKWLQWSYLDVEKGLGGVETHIRSLARELNKLGVEASISNDPAELFSQRWDVIHTHGSNLVVMKELMARIKNRQKQRPLWVHTLHGLTHERMLACREYFWPGGYKAMGREFAASLSADVLFAIHSDMSLFKLLSKTRKTTMICGNGWDSWSDDEKPETTTTTKAPSLALPENFWLYIGRGDDAVKGTAVLREAVEKNSDFNLVAVPGAGFEKLSRVISLGPKTPQEVRELLHHAQGLVLTSVYEGLPLVVLEALAEGVPVVTTNVGGLKTLPDELKGFFKMTEPSLRNLELLLKQAEFENKKERKERALYNRQLLQTWKNVAEIVLKTVRFLRVSG